MKAHNNEQTRLRKQPRMIIKPKPSWEAIAIVFVLCVLCNSNLMAESSTETDCCSMSNPVAQKAKAFVGVWEPMGKHRELPQKAPPKFTPEASKSISHQIELRDQGKISYDFSAICISPSSPTMTTLGPQEMLLDEKKMTWIIEAVNGIRWIWLDGREHPPLDELRFTAMGHSVAHWEDDVFVIDTVGFMDKAMVYMNIVGNISIYPSPQMHYVEKLRLIEEGQAITIERTLTDPVNLAEPWVTTVRYEKRDWEIGETICMENNKVFFYFEPDELPVK